jgi:hypothetical protein
MGGIAQKRRTPTSLINVSWGPKSYEKLYTMAVD